MHAHTITAAALDAMKFRPISPEPKRAPTWADLVKAEPRLADVERQAMHHRARDDDWRAWSLVKLRMMRFVGWTAERKGLRTSAAYDTAYAHLLACWEAGCIPTE